MKKNSTFTTRLMLNRVGAMLLALLLLVGGIPMQVLAEDGEQHTPAEISENGDDLTNTEPIETIDNLLETIVPGEGSLPDDAVLLTQFIEKESFGRVITPTPESGKPKLRAPRKIKLEGADLIVYNKLRDEINAVATGTNTITSFTINASDIFPDKADKWFSAEDLGLETLGNSQTGITDEALAAMKSQFPVDVNRIFNALMFDCPYDLFWFDKTVGYSGSPVLSRMGYSQLKLSRFQFYLPVSPDYVADNPTTVTLKVNNQDVTVPIETNSSLIQSVNSAISNAAQIVEDAKNKDDYNKLLYYKNQICQAVTYNKSAAENDDTPYGDPWQLIYVFDNVDETNVVCEGYSKAFKYLCDLTAEKGYFDNDTIECHIVTGEMSGGTGSGGHMWNIITIDGENYLVDVTNCDEGSIGYSEELFLVGNPNGYITLQGTIIDNNGERDVEFYQYSFPTLGLTYLYDQDTMDSYDSEIILATSNYTPPAPHTHTIENVPAQAATCTQDGNSEYWTCSVCNKYFSDENGTTEIEENSWVIPAGHTLEKTDAKAATCTQDGNSEYWTCSVCNKYFSDENGTTEIEENSWVIPAGHTLEKTDAKAATCTEAGNSAYWTCSGCGKFFADAEGKSEIEENSWVITATGQHNLTETEAKAATCTEAGNSAYWTCSVCNKYFSDENGTTEIEENSWVIPAGHTLEKTDANAATCTEAGNSAYWTCSVCNKYFSDENGTTEIEENSWVIPAGHTLEKTDAKAATCTEAGNSAYWTCSVCNKYFSDENGTTEIEENSWVIPAGHTLEKTDTNAATCTEAGNNAYWTCSVCHKYFSDENGTTEIQENSWITPQLSHDLKKTDAKAATCTETGNKAYWTCGTCKKVFSDNKATTETTVAKMRSNALGHDSKVTIPAKQATCTATGLTEGKKCSRCDTITVKQNTVKALGHDSKVTIPAKQATCTATGLTEGKKCSRCGTITVKQNTIKALGHKYGPWTNLNATQHQRVCARDKSHVEKANHTWNAGKVTKAATCGAAGVKTYTCTACKATKTETIKATGAHKWDAGKVTKQPTTATAGVRTYTCSVCKGTKTEPIAKLKEVTLRRVFGDNRFTTALAIAETYMNETGQAKLNSIIVASGTNFPDALAGSYLAKAKNAPIIIWHDSRKAMLQSFIKQKLKPGGTVYILGGTGAVSDTLTNYLRAQGIKYSRYGGTNRYDTNRIILNAVGIKNEELLVCDATEAGKGINALIASATGKPILLVAKGGLLEPQKTWLSQNKSKITKITIIGNANSVDTKVESQLKAYGKVSRIGGKNGDEVSANVGKTYFKDAKEVFIATMDNYPDGLCGGPLAICVKGPIILVNSSVNTASANYCKTLNNLQRATVFGGPKAMPEATARKVAKSSKSGWSIFEYTTGTQAQAATSASTTKTAAASTSTTKTAAASASATKATTSQSSSDMVYWVPSGEVYHLTKNCRSLSRSKTILSGTIAESGKPRVCKNCSH